MRFNEWLETERGRATDLALYFGVTLQAISSWKTHGVPPKHMKEIRELSDGAVTLDDMIPDTPRRSRARKLKAA